MEIQQKQILDLIIANADQVKFVAHYGYKTGTYSSGYIAVAELDDLEKGSSEQVAQAKAIIEIVDQFHDVAVEKLKLPGTDSKTAVECLIPGIEKPVFFVLRDSSRIITFEIRPEGQPRYFPAAESSQGVTPEMVVDTKEGEPAYRAAIQGVSFGEGKE